MPMKSETHRKAKEANLERWFRTGGEISACFDAKSRMSRKLSTDCRQDLSYSRQVGLGIDVSTNAAIFRAVV